MEIVYTHEVIQYLLMINELLNYIEDNFDTNDDEVIKTMINLLMVEAIFIKLLGGP